jgi:hypothetical protein
MATAEKDSGGGMNTTASPRSGVVTAVEVKKKIGR